MSSKKSNENIKFIPKLDLKKKPDEKIKVVIIGDCRVGKTALIERIICNKFLEEYHTTIGFLYNNLNLKINDKILELDIWDTSGNEVYKSLAKNHLQSASIAILVYDITNRASFKSIDSWLKELDTNPTIILVGNKSDLEDKRQVQIEEIKNNPNLKDKIFFECSVKNGINVKEIFIEAAKLLYKKSNINSTDKKPLENAQKVNEINNEVIDNSKNEKVIKKEEKNCCSRCFD